ncbi:hypothetical protein LXQ54_004427 [Salmonella enterica]|nr:hypothetical protein [Salmonella enterica]
MLSLPAPMLHGLKEAPEELRMAALPVNTSANTGSQVTATEVKLHKQHVFSLRQHSGQHSTTSEISG